MLQPSRWHHIITPKCVCLWVCAYVRLSPTSNRSACLAPGLAHSQTHTHIDKHIHTNKLPPPQEEKKKKNLGNESGGQGSISPWQQERELTTKQMSVRAWKRAREQERGTRRLLLLKLCRIYHICRTCLCPGFKALVRFSLVVMEISTVETLIQPMMLKESEYGRQNSNVLAGSCWELTCYSDVSGVSCSYLLAVSGQGCSWPANRLVESVEAGRWVSPSCPSYPEELE